MVDMFEKGVDDLNDITLYNEFNEAVEKISSYASYIDEKESDFAKAMKDKFSSPDEMSLFVKIIDKVFESIKTAEDVEDYGDFNEIRKNLIKTVLISLSETSVNELSDYPDIIDGYLQEFLSDKSFLEVDLEDEESEEKSLNKNIFVLSEKVENKASIDEVVNEDKEEVKENDDTVHHPLWYILNKVDEKQSENVEVESDKESSDVEKVDFFGKEVSVGDKSKINFINDENNVSSVSMGSDFSSMNIAHKKNKEVSRVALDSTFKGVIDYMEAKEEVPFEFVINTKTEDFKKSVVGAMIMYSIKDRIKDKIKDNEKINYVSEENVLNGKVSSFVIDGLTISYDDFSKFSSYEDFVKFEEKLKNKDNETETETETVRKRLLENELVNNVSR